MNAMIRYPLSLLVLALPAVVLVACDDGAPDAAQQTSATTAGASEQLPASLILENSPGEAKDLVAVQKSAKAGETVTLRGRVGGTEKPLADDRAMLTLIDPTVITCETMPDDACPTPWDACCDPDAAAKSATIQVVGPDGRPLKAPLSGVGGIAPLKELIVTGKVRTPADTGALVIDATGIYVKT